MKKLVRFSTYHNTTMQPIPREDVGTVEWDSGGNGDSCPLSCWILLRVPRSVPSFALTSSPKKFSPSTRRTSSVLYPRSRPCRPGPRGRAVPIAVTLQSTVARTWREGCLQSRLPYRERSRYYHGDAKAESAVRRLVSPSRLVGLER